MNTTFLKKHGSTILSCMGIVGVAATTILAIKATPKAICLLEEAEDKKGEELSKIEKIKIAAPVYIPTIATGLSTIACIASANFLNKKHQANLASAYALINASYNNYRRKVNELYGEDADSKIIEKMAEDEYNCKCEDEFELEDGKQLFFDYKALSYFESTFGEVLQKVELEDGLECYVICTPFDSDIHLDYGLPNF